MEFQVLGPVTAHDDETEVELGGPKQRLVLAILLAAQGATVSTDALMDGLWQESLPATARKTLQGYIHHLRTKIGEALQTDRAGYSLRVRDALVDERRFGATVDEARTLVVTDPTAASNQLADALALWRGNPYADLDDAPVLRSEITRLQELRLVALGDRIDADLAVGRHETIVGELESLTVEYPLQERFRAQQMLALYRSGRHGEALRAYARARDQFIEEMGIEPSAQLRAIEERVLARDETLDLDLPLGFGVTSSGSMRAVRGYELRETIARSDNETLYRGYHRSVGREVAIRVSTGEQANDPTFIARYDADLSRVANLDHPNIVYVQDSWREPGHVYQVMQWIEGERLDSRLTTRRPDQWTALKILEQIGGALGVAHAAGVVHGRVSAGCIIVGSAGDAYLTDFVVGRPPGDERDDLVALVKLAHTLLLGMSPVADGGSRSFPSSPETAELSAVLDGALTGNGCTRPDELAPALRRVLGGHGVELADEMVQARSDIRCPYKGLHAFQIADVDDFHGRDELSARLQELVGRRRLVAVVGPSGSGKSSLVKAGLVPRLIEGPRPMMLTEMYPGPYPFDALEDALRSIAVSDDAIGDQLVADHRGLVRVLDLVLPRDDTELVLVIDQFEELFAMVASESLRALFLDSLVAAVRHPASRLRVVLTLRADFFDRPLRYANFGAEFEAGLVPVSMPGDTDLAAAIERPAAAVGLTVEPGLVGEIVRDVGDEPGGLPLLQYALTELFERRSRNMLTVEAYRASGGVLGALASRAEGLYADLGPVGQQAVRQVFLRLVAVEEGAATVRRRVTRADLAALEIDPAALAEGLQRFGAHRLLTFDADPVSRAPTVEVAHEALLREWKRLRRWIDDERDELVLRKRLDAAMQEWEESGEDPAYLLRGSRLTQFDAWAAGTDLALSSGERSFLQSSREHDERLARTAAARRRRVMLSLVAAAVIAAGFGIYGLVQRQQAAAEARNAETARLGSQAGFVVERDRQMALLMAVETFRRDPGFEGLSALQRVLIDAGPFLGVLGAGTEYSDVHWVTADRLLATTATELHLVDTVSREVLTLPVELDRTGGIRATSPSGTAAVIGADGRAVLVDVATGRIEAFPPADGSQALAVSDDGAVVAVGHGDGTLELVDRHTGVVTASVLANPPRRADDLSLDPGVVLTEAAAENLQGLSGLVFDPDGNRLMTAGGVFLRVWNVDDLSPAGPEIVHSWGPDDFNLTAARPRWFWFDPIDDDMATVSGESFVVSWRLSTGERATLDALPSPVVAAVDDGRGDPLVLVDDGRVIRANGADSGDFVFDVQESDVAALAVESRHRRFAVATNDGIVTASLDGTQLLARSVPIGSSVRPTLSRDGSTLAAGLVSDGLFDLSSEPPRRVQFDVGVEIAEFAGSPATFEFANAEHANVLLWTSTFMEMRNAYDLDSGRYLGDFWGSFIPAWSDDGTRVAKEARRGGTRVEELAADMTLYESSAPMAAADFDADGQRVLVIPVDRSRALQIDLSSGIESALPEMPGGIVAAGYTPNGEIVAVGGRGSVWLLESGALTVRQALEDADLAVASVMPPPVISADGRWMFSTTDGVARVWHLESGRQLGKPFPTDAGGAPWGIADGDLLRVVTPVAENALVWNLDMARWVDLACRAAGRNMTPEEWATFGPRDSNHRPTCPET